MTYQENAQSWLDYFNGGHSSKELAEMLADEVIFISPVVHTPQVGKMITLAYLTAANETFGNEHFKYTRVYDAGTRAVFEFETKMDGIFVNGVDMIAWNEDGKIIEFKVMVRPLKAVQTVHAKMGEMLEQLKKSA